jgi:hypothetical protein
MDGSAVPKDFGVARNENQSTYYENKSSSETEQASSLASRGRLRHLWHERKSSGFSSGSPNHDLSWLAAFVRHDRFKEIQNSPRQAPSELSPAPGVLRNGSFPFSGNNCRMVLVWTFVR